MVKPVRKSSSKNPPIFSHEFVIQNHVDIVSCSALVFILGLLVQATAPYAAMFVMPFHNLTDPTNSTNAGQLIFYGPGLKDISMVFFYSLVCITLHAAIQEYLLDKMPKRLHLSKSKLASFNNSGQLSVFYALSVVWSIDLLLRERLIPEVVLIWSNYPQPMTFLLKLYLIIQMAYSLHEIPELYFQKVKRDEWGYRTLKSLTTMLLVAIPYALNYSRLLLCLLALHHMSALVHHVCQIIQTVDKEERFARVTRLVATIFHIASRLTTIVLSTLTLWHGLAKEHLNNAQDWSIVDGHFNTYLVRVPLLAGIILLQMYLIFNVINEQVSRAKERAAEAAAISQLPGKTASKSQAKRDKSKNKAKRILKEESDLPEVDQNTNKLKGKQKAK